MAVGSDASGWAGAMEEPEAVALVVVAGTVGGGFDEEAVVNWPSDEDP